MTAKAAIDHRLHSEGLQHVSKRLRIGIVGAGGIAQGAHIPGYKSVGDRVELAAISDIDVDRAKQVAEEHGFKSYYQDYEEMLQKADLDAVSVCTPNKFHAPVTIAALEAGCHVLCEKPPAITAAEAKAMVDKAAETGKKLTFGLHQRFQSEVQACKRLIDGGELGHIYAVRVDALRRRGIPGWGVFTNKELQGGGPVIDIGVHMLDVALYLMGYPKPVQILAKTYQEIGTRPGVGVMGEWDWDNFQVEDLAMAMIKFDNGASLLLESSFAQDMEELERMGVRLSGRNGGATVFPLKVFKEMYGGLYDITPAWLPRVERAHTAQVQHFVEACFGEHDVMVKGDEAVRLQQILENIYISADTDDIVYIGDAEAR